jgi:hypothetical protein
LIRTQHSHRVVIVVGIVFAQYAVDDRMAEAHTMVSLVEQGWADQNDVARAFARWPRTLRRYERRVETGGLAALGRRRGYPAGRSRLKSARLRLVARLNGCPAAAIPTSRSPRTPSAGSPTSRSRRKRTRCGTTPSAPAVTSYPRSDT